MDDDVLAAQAGDRRAFERIVLAHQDAVVRLAMRFFSDQPDLAREMAQEAFVRFYETLDRVDPSLPVRPWLSRIVANLCKDHLKRREHALRAADGGEWIDELPGAEAAQDPSERLEEEALRRRLEEALATLRPAYRDILVMKDVDGLSYDEIQAATGLPVTTLKIRVIRARERMRKALKNV